MKKSAKPAEPETMAASLGVRSKLQGHFLNCLSADFEVNGMDAVIKARRRDPCGYVRMVASLLPKEIKIERPLEGLSDSELAAAVDYLKSKIAAKATGAGNTATKQPKSAEGLPPLH